MLEGSRWIWFAFAGLVSLGVLAAAAGLVAFFLHRRGWRLLVVNEGHATTDAPFATVRSSHEEASIRKEITKLKRALEPLASYERDLQALNEAVRKLQIEVDALKPRNALTSSTISVEPRVQTPEIVYSVREDASPRASTSPTNEIYRCLAKSGLKAVEVQPLFASLDMAQSAAGSGYAPTLHVFRQSENKQDPFVAFVDVDTREGWLYPNPLRTFTEAMKYVFPTLSYEMFDTAKAEVAPVRIEQIGEDMWRRKP